MCKYPKQRYTPGENTTTFVFNTVHCTIKCTLYNVHQWFEHLVTQHPVMMINNPLLTSVQRGSSVSCQVETNNKIKVNKNLCAH